MAQVVECLQAGSLEFKPLHHQKEKEKEFLLTEEQSLLAHACCFTPSERLPPGSCKGAACAEKLEVLMNHWAALRCCELAVRMVMA
jgi:hypothetical protein